jgi:preprotein translocase subunit SecA
VQYQREGFQMFQTMMGQIKEESVGYLYNLEVEVRREAEGELDVEAKGLVAPAQDSQRLEYSAANDAGEVEVRNERGQVQQAATNRLRQAAAAAAATGEQAPAPEQPAARGAFGQPTSAPTQGGGAGQNRAERRAAQKRK